MSNSIEPTHSASPARRAWARFRRNRLGFNSLVVFVVLLITDVLGMTKVFPFTRTMR